eukprot:m.202142 g.202142  ORF g.202142 m.202142 type:complete len:129 (+) comp14976_c0_seq19:201-587(+)
MARLCLTLVVMAVIGLAYAHAQGVGKPTKSTTTSLAVRSETKPKKNQLAKDLPMQTGLQLQDNVLFASTIEGAFLAYDFEKGNELWRLNVETLSGTDNVFSAVSSLALVHRLRLWCPCSEHKCTTKSE